MRRILRWALFWGVLGAAVWLLAYWALGSAWGRTLAERRLGRFLDLEVSVRSVVLEWPFCVVVEGVQGRLPGEDSGSPDLSVMEFRVRPFRKRVEIRRPRLVLRQGPAGDWQPEVLRGWVPRPGPEETLEEVLQRVARSWGSRWNVDLATATVLGRSKDGEEVAFFGGLTWRARPLALSGRPSVVHHRVSVQVRNGIPSETGEPLRSEWLSAPGWPIQRLWPDGERAVSEGTVSASVAEELPFGASDAGESLTEPDENPAEPDGSLEAADPAVFRETCPGGGRGLS